MSESYPDGWIQGDQRPESIPPPGYVPAPPGYVPAPPGYVPAPSPGYVPAPSPGYAPVSQRIPAPPQPPTNQMAMVSLILGIAGIMCFGFFTGIPAIITGVMGRRQVAESAGAEKGDGQALTGIVLGSIAIAWSFFGILFWIIAASAG